MKTQWALCALLLAALASVARAADDQPKTEIAPATPGTYNINTDTQQLVMRSYEVTSIQPELRGNLVRGLQPLLAKDGSGGSMTTAEQTIGGRKIIILTVTATEKMQESIAQTVAQINKGDFGFYGTFPAVINYQPKYRSVEALAKIMEREITPIGYVYFDKPINQLTVGDDPSFESYLLSVLKAYDTPPPQLNVALEVIESKSDVAGNLGVWWQAWQRALPTNVAVSLAGAGEAADFQVLGWDAILSGLNPEVLASFLNFLEDRGVVKITSRTTLHVFNAEPAEFRAGVDVPYRAVRSEGDGSGIKDELAFEGLTLSVLPSIAELGRRLDVDATVTSVVGVSAAGIPTVATSHVKTVIGTNGDRSVLSGLKRTVEGNQRVGVPLLSRIPILKYVFSRERTTKEEWDVTILLSLGDKQAPPAK